MLILAVLVCACMVTLALPALKIVPVIRTVRGVVPVMACVAAAVPDTLEVDVLNADVCVVCASTV